MVIISTVCSAEKSCLNKKDITNQKFNINSKSYKFISYHCENKNSDKDAFFSEPGILEIHAKNFNKSFKNVIGIKGMIGIIIAKWNNKPEFCYINTPSEYTTADIPIIIENNNLMVECIYINSQLENFMAVKYSYCGDKKIIEDGFGEEGFENLFPEFYLYSIYNNIHFPESNEYLSHKKFDVFIGKIDDISFYRRYSSLDDYSLNKFIVVMVNKEKEYHFKESEIYQRMAGKTSSERFIGLDIIDAKGNITFYDKRLLLELLNKSTLKPDITSYIQQKKAELYNNPNENEPTGIYLVQNDFVKILDVIWDKNEYSNVWFKVSYNSKSHGEIIKWVKWNAFTSW